MRRWIFSASEQHPIANMQPAIENGWFAARPSGTEDVHKLYKESFKGKDHLNRFRKRHSP